MKVLGHACFGYLEKKRKIFNRKLPNIAYYTKFCKNTLVMFNLLPTFILSKSYIVMKSYVKLVSHWVIIFSGRNWKCRHDNFQAMFCIVRLISNCP